MVVFYIIKSIDDSKNNASPTTVDYLRLIKVLSYDHDVLISIWPENSMATDWEHGFYWQQEMYTLDTS